jgi:hypothetical protein
MIPITIQKYENGINRIPVDRLVRLAAYTLKRVRARTVSQRLPISA